MDLYKNLLFCNLVAMEIESKITTGLKSHCSEVVQGFPFSPWNY